MLLINKALTLNKEHLHDSGGDHGGYDYARGLASSFRAVRTDPALMLRQD
jgi:hypothetical protein